MSISVSCERRLEAAPTTWPPQPGLREAIGSRSQRTQRRAGPSASDSGESWWLTTVLPAVAVIVSLAILPSASQLAAKVPAEESTSRSICSGSWIVRVCLLAFAFPTAVSHFFEEAIFSTLAYVNFASFPLASDSFELSDGVVHTSDCLEFTSDIDALFHQQSRFGAVFVLDRWPSRPRCRCLFGVDRGGRLPRLAKRRRSDQSLCDRA